VREVVLWISGAALAFFITAGAFLFLANLANSPSDKSLAPDPSSRGSGPTLELSLDEDRLASLRPLPGQILELAIKNAGAERLTDANVSLVVSSENTALSNTRYYRQTVKELPAGGTARVRFEFDLSEPVDAGSPAVPEPSREILEIKAVTPEGISTVRTAILPP
jgi:hypothetical protein